jgi:4-amino-4-deoxy-L-arabinose transferase-like glycosyltransferase
MKISKEIILLSLLSIPILIYIHTKGFIPYDEGWFLQAGKRLLDGEKIYSDFEFLYNPGVVFLNSLAFAIFGENILASRILSMINSYISILLVFLISKELKIRRSIRLLLSLSFLFWAGGHINFTWPAMLCLTTALATAYLFLKAKSKDENRSFFIIGILASITFLFKQNFGIAIFLADLIYISSNKELRSKSALLAFLIGNLSIGIWAIIYFISQGTLLTYIKEIYHFTVLKIFNEGILNSPLPWAYPAPFYSQFFKFALYLSPLIISIFSLCIIRINKLNHLFFLPIITIAYYLLSIRPTTDYMHLTPLIALCILPISLIISSRIKLSNLFIILFLLLGIYSSIFRNYYKWNTPLIDQTIFNKNSVYLFTDSKENTNISEVSNYFRDIPNDELFIYNFAPAFYLILDKSNPTRYDYLHSGVLDENKQKEIVKILKDRKIKYILANIDISNEKTLLANFIRSEYMIDKKTNEYTIWRLE